MRKLALLGLAILFLMGCASKKYVHQELQKMNQDVDKRVNAVEESVEKNEMQIRELDARTQEVEQKVQKLSVATQEALERAQEAHKLAQGKLLYEVVLSDDKVHFGFNSATLSPEAQAALDAFAENLKKENKNVYLEIQGHTDSIGSEEYNYQLGLKRAQAVRDYLHNAHQIPLHRMQIISYGETQPVFPNTMKEGREKNRRVVIVVME